MNNKLNCISIDDIKKASKSNNIDLLIKYTKYIDKSIISVEDSTDENNRRKKIEENEVLEKALIIYENYFNKHLDITTFTQKTIISIKNRRQRNKLGEDGMYICKLE